MKRVAIPLMCSMLLASAAIAADHKKETASKSDRANMAQAKESKPAAAAATASTASTQGVRNWAEMDTNKDNLISPEEMTAWMQKNAEWAKKK